MKKILLSVIFITISNIIFSQDNNIEYDTTIYFLVKQMPLFIGDYNILSNNVSAQLDKETESFLKNNNTNITFNITCKGKAVIIRSNEKLTQFYNIIENELNNLLWIPGNNNRRNVNVQSIIPVRIFDDNLSIPIDFKMVKGKLAKGIIFNEENKNVIPNVRLVTKYNNCSYFSDNNGEVEFYCEPNDEIEIRHINFLPVNFKASNNTNLYQIEMKNVVYELETLDLTKYSPKKLPYKKFNCTYKDWQESNNQIVILGIGKNFPSIMASINGGYECLYNYIAKKFELHVDAIKNDYHETVDVTFTVFEDGTLNNIIFSKQLKYGIDLSLEKIFKEMPKWEPASQARSKTKQKFVIKLIIGNSKYWEKIYG